MAVDRSDGPEIDCATPFRQPLLSALTAGYLTPQGDRDARPPEMLLHSCYNRKAGRDTDHEMVRGDFFLLKALSARVRLA